MDFTLKKYRQLLEKLEGEGYRFQTYRDFIENPCEGKTIILRHDVDLKPQNSWATAKIEADLGICASYYFRAVPESWDDDIIRDIAAMGHEVGYHYESLTTCHGDIDAAYRDFRTNLDKLRQLLSLTDNSQQLPDEGQNQHRGSVSTICMHGSPRSPFDSKDIWKKYSYKELGVVAEPYLDTDWSHTFYLTDTGRRWDGFHVSVRDRIPHWQDVWNRQGLTFHSTDDIIARVEELPCCIMITTHPQRWTDKRIPWLKELLLQNAKNVVKGIRTKD